MTIKIITEPACYLVGRQQIDDAELSRFLADEGVERWDTDTTIAGQKLVEVGGRLCYASYAKPRPGGNEKYIGHILEVGHGSVVEHCVFNLIITGVSRSLTHELVRHRAGWSYSQLSQRFVDEAPDNGTLDLVEPPLVAECRRIADDYCQANSVDRGLIARCHIEAPSLIRAAASVVEDWDHFVPQVAEAYRSLDGHASAFLDIQAGVDPWGKQGRKDTGRRKCAREAARSVLPNATETKIFVTANARALRHFLELRGSRHADAEIRRLAIAILGIMQAEAPNIFADFSLADLPGGDGQEIVVENHKV